jgi:hypothetical protein
LQGSSHTSLLLTCGKDVRSASLGHPNGDLSMLVLTPVPVPVGGPDISGRHRKQSPCPIRRRMIDSLFLAWPRVLKPIRKICEISPKRGTEARGARACGSGDGLCVGRDSGDAVSQEYKTAGTLKGGTIFGVAVDVSPKVYRPRNGGHSSNEALELRLDLPQVQTSAEATTVSLLIVPPSAPGLWFDADNPAMAHKQKMMHNWRCRHFGQPI